jgi:hypothetical protein
LRSMKFLVLSLAGDSVRLIPAGVT